MRRQPQGRGSARPAERPSLCVARVLHRPIVTILADAAHSPGSIGR
jgi:hypothetical protein